MTSSRTVASWAWRDSARSENSRAGSVSRQRTCGARSGRGRLFRRGGLRALLEVDHCLQRGHGDLQLGLIGLGRGEALALPGRAEDHFAHGMVLELETEAY